MAKNISEKIPLQTTKFTTSPHYTNLESGNEEKVQTENFWKRVKFNSGSCKFSDRSKGILLAIASGAFFTMCTAGVKLLKHMDPREILAIRALQQTIVSIIISSIINIDVKGPPKARPLLITQGIIGGLTLTSLFFALHRLPVGDASALIFSSPVLVMVFGSVFLKEPFTAFRLLVLVAMVTGGVLIARPPAIFGSLKEAESTEPWGITAALGATFFYSINYILTRKLKEVHFISTLFYFSALSTLVGLVSLSVFGTATVPSSAGDWAILILLGVLGSAGQGLLALALQFEGAGTVSLTRSLDIVLAYVFQVTIFNEVPGWMSIIGAFLVVLCVALISLEPRVLRTVPNAGLNLFSCITSSDKQPNSRTEDADYEFTDSGDILSE